MNDAPLADAIEAEAWRVMFAAMPTPMREATGARVLDAGGAVVFVAPGIPTAFFNRAIGLGSDRPATEDDLDEVIACFAAASVRTFFVHKSATTRARGDMDAWLRARGLVPFVARPTWAKCLRGVEPPPVVATSLVVRPADGTNATALGSVIATAHAMPSPMAEWVAALVGRPRWHSYAVFDGDALVGGGVSYVRGHHAWLGLGGTAETHRKRGGQRALLTRRVADAIALGATATATETGEPVGGEPNPSLANMMRCGFRRVASRENWTLRS